MTNKSGFTLVELLVAVGIIGVLASVSVVSVNSVRQKGRDAKRISEVKQMQTALEAFYSSHGSYPLGMLAGAQISNLGVGTGANGVAQAGDEMVLCTTDNVADAAVNEYGGFGFAYRTNASAAAGDGGCVGTPFMQAVPKDPLAPTTQYTYNAQECATGDTEAPCNTYAIGFTLEAGTGGFSAAPHTATPNGIQ